MAAGLTVGSVSFVGWGVDSTVGMGVGSGSDAGPDAWTDAGCASGEGVGAGSWLGGSAAVARCTSGFWIAVATGMPSE